MSSKSKKKSKSRKSGSNPNSNSSKPESADASKEESKKLVTKEKPQEDEWAPGLVETKPVKWYITGVKYLLTFVVLSVPALFAASIVGNRVEQKVASTFDTKIDAIDKAYLAERNAEESEAIGELAKLEKQNAILNSDADRFKAEISKLKVEVENLRLPGSGEDAKAEQIKNLSQQLKEEKAKISQLQKDSKLSESLKDLTEKVTSVFDDVRLLKKKEEQRELSIVWLPKHNSNQAERTKTVALIDEIKNYYDANGYSTEVFYLMDDIVRPQQKINPVPLQKPLTQKSWKAIGEYFKGKNTLVVADCFEHDCPTSYELVKNFHYYVLQFREATKDEKTSVQWMQRVAVKYAAAGKTQANDNLWAVRFFESKDAKTVKETLRSSLFAVLHLYQRQHSFKAE